MNRTHDITKRDFLVYVDGFGVYINVLFAERHRIREGSSIGKSFMDLHHKEVPPMESTTSHIWLSDEQKEQGDNQYNLNKPGYQVKWENRKLPKVEPIKG